MVNYCGVSSSIVRQQKMGNLTGWKAIRSVYKFHGIQILKPWRNGQMLVKSFSESSINIFDHFTIYLIKGQTGFPWIDAIMTQLREEGWIHHLARHAVACFLTR